MAQIDLTKYGITGAVEILHNPSYEQLFAEETKPGLEGFEVGQVTELGAVNVMTGVYTGRSPKDKFIVVDEETFVKLYHISTRARYAYFLQFSRPAFGCFAKSLTGVQIPHFVWMETTDN